MRVFTKAAVLALSFAFSTSAAQALSLVEGAQPAEYPPSSYTASTYVDSRGCVYIRAGYGGNVTWVPQVTRAREVVCGARPSLAPSTPAPSMAEAAPAPAPTPSPAPAAVSIAAPATMPAPRPAPATSPAPSTAISRTVTLTCPSGGANKQVRKDGINVILRCEAGQVGTKSYIVRYSSGERVKVIVNPPLQAPVQVANLRLPAGVSVTITDETTGTVRTTGSAASRSACPDRSGVSAAYTGTSGVRCGPQAIPAVPRNAASVATSTTRIITAPAATTRNVAPPAGYRVAWEDDRLNPNRGPRTNAGNAQMDLIWSRTVPRELYDISTGRNVTALFPGLRYPNMPSAAQIRTASGS